MSENDGSVLGVTQILSSGPVSHRWNVVLLSEGFQSSQTAQYATAAQNFVAELTRTPPFDLVIDGINVFRVDVTSTDSGADDPVACGGTGGTAATYFDASFCHDGTNRRLLSVNDALALKVARAQVPDYDVVVVIVNSPIFGGSGGGVAVYSLGPNAVQIALHELGHTAFGLADEYAYLRGCGSGETDRNNFSGPEPKAANVTNVSGSNRQALKWKRYVLSSTPLPTTQNPNCTQCDPKASPVSVAIVGTFEGANSYHCGAYRPEFDCKMRTLAAPFCRICHNHILGKLRFHSPLRVEFAWKGVGGDPNIYFSRDFEGYVDKLRGRGTSAGPVIAPFMGIFMAWKGVGNDQRIWWSRLSHIDGVTWESQHELLGVGTSTAPAVTVWDNKLYMAWKGIHGDEGIYFATLSTAGLWSPQAGVPGVGTSTRPALAVYRGRLFMVWKGVEGDQSIYFTSFDGTRWAAQAPIPGVGTSASPALAVLNDRLYMAWKGIDGDLSMYFSSFDGLSWQPQRGIPNVGTSDGPTLSAASNRLFMFWRGIPGDESLYYTTYSGTEWVRQRNFFGTGSSTAPGVLAH